MQNRVFRTVVAVAVAATLTSACAYTFHPERRGNHSVIAAAPLVGDLLWLIPGIIPGVVFLIVDFTSGAIYKFPAGYHEQQLGAQRPTPPPSPTAQSTPTPQNR